VDPLFSLEQKRQEGWQYEEAEGTTHRHVVREAVFLVTDTHTSNLKQSIKFLLIGLRL